MNTQQTPEQKIKSHDFTPNERMRGKSVPSAGTVSEKYQNFIFRREEVAHTFHANTDSNGLVSAFYGYYAKKV